MAKLEGGPPVGNYYGKFHSNSCYEGLEGGKNNWRLRPWAKMNEFNHKLKCSNLVNTYLDTYLGNEFTRIIHIDIFMVWRWPQPQQTHPKASVRTSVKMAQTRTDDTICIFTDSHIKQVCTRSLMRQGRLARVALAVGKTLAQTLGSGGRVSA